MNLSLGSGGEGEGSFHEIDAVAKTLRPSISLLMLLKGTDTSDRSVLQYHRRFFKTPRAQVFTGKCPLLHDTKSCHPPSGSGVKGPSFLRCLQSVQPGHLRWRRGYILPEGPSDSISWWLLLQLLLLPPLLLSEKLLGLQHDPGIEAMPA